MIRRRRSEGENVRTSGDWTLPQSKNASWELTKDKSFGDTYEHIQVWKARTGGSTYNYDQVVVKCFVKAPPTQPSPEPPLNEQVKNLSWASF